MPTSKQITGTLGEKLVASLCACPRCDRFKTLKLLPPNFKCVDLICDFCSFVAQVKTQNVQDPTALPKTILGAAWEPQRARMEAGIFIPLFIVLLMANTPKKYALYYLPSTLQKPEFFVPRNPLSVTAKRAGWQGFFYDLRKISPESITRIV